jgi:hypothetical protein
VLNLSVNLAICGFVGAILINVVMLIKFLARANQAGPAIAEIFHTLFMGSLGKSYLKLLANDGVEPTLADELLYRVDIILKLMFLVGSVLVGLGWFITS